MNDEMLDAEMKDMRTAHAYGRAKSAGNPRQQNAAALAHYVTDGKPYSREGMTLSEYLAAQAEDRSPRTNYARSVSDSLDRPVISTQAAAGLLGYTPEQGDYPTGYMTPREFLAEKAAMPARQLIEKVQTSTGTVPPWAEAMAQMIEEQALAQTEDVAGVLAGTLKSTEKGVVSAANELRQLVTAHGPNGPLAAPASRTESEDAAVRSQYGGSAEYMLTGAGKKNHEAQRVAELWSAQDEGYAPASTFSQVQRALAPVFAYPYNAVTGNSNRLVEEPWDEMAMISRPDGKLEYAASVYARGAGDEAKEGPVSVYTPEGRAKQGIYDPSSNPMGLVNALNENQSFAPGWMRQNVGDRMLEAGNEIGNYLGGGDSNMIANLRGLRQAYNRITPVRPDHIPEDTFQRLGQQAKGATTELRGWASAKLGPQLSDLENATLQRAMQIGTMGQFGGDKGRSYLSPAASAVVETPGEMLADPTNLMFNAAAPLVGAAKGGINGAIRGGVRSAALGAGDDMIRSFAKAPTRMMDDFVDESVVEGPALNAATSSFGDYFRPEQENLLMGKADPNAPGFDARVEQKAIDARQRQMEAASEYGQLMGQKPAPYTAPTKSWLPAMLLSR